MSTVFSEGDHVDYLGDGADGIPPARGRIMAVASQHGVHVKWLTGPRVDRIDMVSIYDLEKSASAVVTDAPVITATSVWRAMKDDGEAGVLTFLAAAKQTDTWTDIARDTLEFVEARLRADASMELPYEQLTDDQVERVVSLGARTLLAQAFGQEAS